MADYTALEQMRAINRERYQIDGPAEPPAVPEESLSGDLERSALHFLRSTCRELRFARDAEHLALRDLDGKSTAPGQIPLNMERDLDRACLERAVHRFMRSGAAADAFAVYFCYLEMFVGNYRGSRKMIELLSEFETNASSLLMKHRDHYSHSVYVFVLGLALYERSPLVRDTYAACYNLADQTDAAHHFLRWWGMAALFHDIGYPFELPFEEVKSYFGDTLENVPYVSYRGTDDFTMPQELLSAFLSEGQRAETAGEVLTPFCVLAENLADKLYPEYADFSGYQKYLKEAGEAECKASYRDYLYKSVLLGKPRDPKRFSGFMDHAVFSALLLMRKMAELIPDELSAICADVLSAIVLHNSMYRYSVTNVKGKGEDRSFNLSHRFALQTHPLAYLLMLCDELQCWDRVAYGQNSRRQFHPFGCDLTVDGNAIRAVYHYDEAFSQDRADSGTYRKMQEDESGSCDFLRDIEDILSINVPGGLSLKIERKVRPFVRRGNLYLSSSSFMHLFDFAVALNAQYAARDYTTKEFKDVPIEEMEAAFDKLSLEYKLSNIEQAAAFGEYLNDLGCFFTDRQVAYPLKRSFEAEELDCIGRREHDRWDREKLSMGWQYGTAFKAFPNKKAVREQTRTHDDLNVPYQALSQTEQAKDTAPMNDMMRLIENYDGLRIYSLK